MDPNLKTRFSSRPWPVVNRGNAINRVQKILKSNHVTGLPSHWPKIYYGQTRKNLAENRTFRNVDAHSLPDGAYLYLIEYNPETNRYHKSFVRVLNKLESGSRHFQLPVRNHGRVIVAAGELSKRGSIIEFNLESGTYTRNLMTRTKNYFGKENYIRLVKNAMRNSRPEYTNKILVPEIPGSLKNLLGNRGNVSFFWNATTEKSRAKVMANLKKAGLNSNSARNLIQKLVNKNSGSASVRSAKRRRVIQ
jgi:hypothetical protein